MTTADFLIEDPFSGFSGEDKLKAHPKKFQKNSKKFQKKKKKPTFCPLKRAVWSAMWTARTTSWMDMPYMPPTRKGPLKARSYTREASE